MNMMRGFFTVGLWTLVSRALGFLRDVLIAGALGSSPVAEAFVIAFSIPNLFRRFFAEGAFNIAFVPIFSKKLEANDAPKDFARDAFSMLAAILIVFSFCATFAMPALVWIMASGFAGDERFDLTVVFGRIAFPYILFISLAALASGVLNSTGRFAAAAAAPVLLNLAFIGALILCHWLDWNVGMTLACTVPVAGVAQLAFVWHAAHKAGFTLIPKIPRITPDLKRLAIIALPAVLAGGVVQINLIVGRQIASGFEGANAWLYYADRLYQLPLGIVGIAVGIVLLPDLSRRLRSGDAQGGKDAFNRAAEFSLLLTIPSAVALFIVPGVFVSVLFERGEFLASDTASTAMATAIYGLGLPAFVLQKIYQPVFFAREDTKSPFYFALLALIVNATIAIGLRPYIGFTAAAYGATFAGWAMLFCLWWGSQKFGDAAQLDERLRLKIGRIVVASLIMGVTIWAAAEVLKPILEMSGYRVLALCAILFFGLVSYCVAGYITGAFTLWELRQMMRKNR
ncbi:murein biosynthesis integral membrane protein MurJ [Planktomarina sp.]|nr:murein biosynthesis integral membrane protein MurJ [Planktomarina sp.]